MQNGQVVWQTGDRYHCYALPDVKGGALATPVLGKNDISNLVIYSLARTPSVGAGIMVALDKNTGQEVWRQTFKNYIWSSPVAVYTPQGKSYIVQCDSGGNVFLLDGKTGKVVTSINIGGNIEASPAVFDNTIVIGTRSQEIYGIRID